MWGASDRIRNRIQVFCFPATALLSLSYSASCPTLFLIQYTIPGTMLESRSMDAVPTVIEHELRILSINAYTHAYMYSINIHTYKYISKTKNVFFHSKWTELKMNKFLIINFKKIENKMFILYFILYLSSN